MKLDRRGLLTAGLALPIASAAATRTREAWTRPATLAPDDSVALWPQTHLDAPEGLTERIVQRSEDPQASDRMLEHIVRPRLDIFRPAKPNGAAVILAPGGGYRYVVVDKEGYELARWRAASRPIFSSIVCRAMDGKRGRTSRWPTHSARCGWCAAARAETMSIPRGSSSEAFQQAGMSRPAC